MIILLTPKLGLFLLEFFHGVVEFLNDDVISGGDVVVLALALLFLAA